MYVRETKTGQKVEWEPDDPDLAAEALANVSGTGVATKSEAKANAAVDLREKGDVAQEVMDEYIRLVEASTV